MGQRADEMRQPQERDQSPEEIRDNIEHTRAEMSETIDAIQERLSPAYLKEQVKDQVRETFHETRTAAVENVKGAGSTMLETIKRNPIPAAIAGLSIGWLLRKGMSESSSRRVYYRPGEEVPYYGTYEAGVERREGGETTMRRAQEQVGQVADQARQTVGSVSGQVSHYGDEMQRQVQRTGDRLDQMLHERPLAVGALALAIGTAVGLALPETKTEQQMMGPASDRLVHRVEDKARETMEKAGRVAEEAQRAAGEEARQQGLTR